MNNREVAKVFSDTADLLEIKGEAIYRILAYRRASESLSSLFPTHFSARSTRP